jgi:hypothetical protein
MEQSVYRTAFCVLPQLVQTVIGWIMKSNDFLVHYESLSESDDIRAA